MMRSLLRTQALIGKWTRALACVGFVGLLLVAVLTTADVLLRWVANAPIRGVMDVNQLMFIIGVASCLPLVVAEKGNITIQFLGDRVGRRSAAWLDAFGAATLLLFVVLIGWQLVVYVMDLFESGRTSWQLRIHVAPYWTVATALVLLCIPVQLTAFLIDLLRAASGVAPPQMQEAPPGIELEVG